jgi:hypothetical protein
MGLSLLNMLGLLSTVLMAHIACYWKFFLLHYMQVLWQYRLYKADHTFLTYLMLQRHLSHLNGRKLLTTAKFKPPIFSLSGFALSYTGGLATCRCGTNPALTVMTGAVLSSVFASPVIEWRALFLVSLKVMQTMWRLHEHGKTCCLAVCARIARRPFLRLLWGLILSCLTPLKCNGICSTCSNIQIRCILPTLCICMCFAQFSQ